MDGPFRSRYLVADLVVVAIVATVVVVLGLSSSRPGGSNSGHADVSVALGQRSGAGRAIPSGFLGLSLEYPAVETYTGADPRAIDPVFLQLIRNLTPGQAPVLRIGGDSADSTWWPLAGMSAPRGVNFTLNQQWLAVTRALTNALGARLILGINLEADDPALAATEAGALLDGIGGGSVQAFELGNEPELYGHFAWYRLPGGRAVTGRPGGYDFGAFTTDFTTIGRALPQVALAGPAFASFAWTNHLPEFLRAQPRVGLVTLHRYPLQSCFVPRSSPRYPTITNLLSVAASTGLADRLAPYAAIAHRHGVPLRLDELNTVSCGAVSKISNTFASALWALDALFELARTGVDGVNLHTFPGAGYELFKFSRTDGRWHASVAPQYYGLLMFAQATPPGSQLLPLASVPGGPVKIWATRARDGRIRVVLINKSTSQAQTISLRVPGRFGVATLERLQAPSPWASTGVTLGAQSFGASTDTGVLQGAIQAVSLAPVKHVYPVNLPAASAALLTLPVPTTP